MRELKKARTEKEASRLNALSRNVYRLMKESGVNQSDIARATDLCQPLISRTLSGSNPRVTTVQTLADYFDVSMDELLRRKKIEQ